MDSDLSFFNNEDFNFAMSSSGEEDSSNRIFLTLKKEEIFEDGEMIGYISLFNKEGFKRGKIMLVFESRQKCRVPKIEESCFAKTQLDLIKENRVNIIKEK